MKKVLFERKKLNFVLASLILFGLLIFVFKVDSNLKFQASVFGAFLGANLTALVLGVFYKQKRIFEGLMLPALFFISVFSFTYYFQNLSLVFFGLFSAFCAFVYYIMLLSLNVFLVCEEKGSVIPLARPAKTFYFLLSVFCLFLLTTSLYKLPFKFGVPFIAIFVCSYLISKSYWWVINLNNPSRVGGFFKLEPFIISLLTLEGFVSFMFLSLEDFFRAVFISAIFYILMNLFESYNNNLFRKSQIVEYAGIVGAIVLLLVLV